MQTDNFVLKKIIFSNTRPKLFTLYVAEDDTQYALRPAADQAALQHAAREFGGVGAANLISNHRHWRSRGESHRGRRRERLRNGIPPMCV